MGRRLRRKRGLSYILETWENTLDDEIHIEMADEGYSFGHSCIDRVAFHGPDHREIFHYYFIRDGCEKPFTCEECGFTFYSSYEAPVLGPVDYRVTAGTRDLWYAPATAGAMKAVLAIDCQATMKKIKDAP